MKSNPAENKLAPIALFVYNRPKHTTQLLNSLKENSNAKNSELYIFSDAAKNENQRLNVQKVRLLITALKGFKNIVIKEQKTNKGLANSIIEGVSEVLKVYGKIIVLEDDLIVSPNFLEFMNKALNKYENTKTIFSISGYCPPAKMPLDFTEDVFLYPRVSSWGWATWQNRWQLADWQVSNFNEFCKSKSKQKAFNAAGQDRTPMLVKQQFGHINSWAIRFDYASFCQNKMTLYPSISKTQNNGADGSGEHVGSTNRFDILLDKRKNIAPLPENPKEYPEISKRIKQTYKKSRVRKWINFFLILFPKSFFAKI